MRADSLKYLTRVYPSLQRTRTRQTEKSSQAFKHLSFLLQEFNSENKFLTRQVKDLLQENQLLKRRKAEDFEASNRMAATATTIFAHTKERKEPYIRKQYIGQSVKQANNKTLSSGPKGILKTNNYQSKITSGSVTTSPIYIPRTRQSGQSKTARTQANVQSVLVTETPQNTNRTLQNETLPKNRSNQSQQLHKNELAQQHSIILPPSLNTTPVARIAPITQFIPQQLPPAPIPEVTIETPNLITDNRNSRRSSTGRKGIQVTSKSPSPDNKSKRNSSRQKDTEDKPKQIGISLVIDKDKSPTKIIEQRPNSLQISLRPFGKDINPPKEAAIQVTPTLRNTARASSQPRLVSSNIQLKIDPKSNIPTFAPVTSFVVPADLKHEVQCAISKPPLEIQKEPIKRTESIGVIPHETAQIGIVKGSKTVDKPIILPPPVQSTIPLHHTQNSLTNYVVLPANLPIRFTFNGTMNLQNSNIQNTSQHIIQAPIIDNNPRRPRILDDHQRRATGQRKFLSLVTRDRKNELTE